MTGKAMLPMGNNWIKFKGALSTRPFFYMEDQKSDNNPNKIPSRMARLAWPKAKYGVIIAVIVIIVINIIYYKDFFLSLFK